MQRAPYLYVTGILTACAYLMFSDVQSERFQPSFEAIYSDVHENVVEKLSGWGLTEVTKAYINAPTDLYIALNAPSGPVSIHEARTLIVDATTLYVNQLNASKNLTSLFSKAISPSDVQVEIYFPKRKEKTGEIAAVVSMKGHIGYSKRFNKEYREFAIEEFQRASDIVMGPTYE